ncbi:MAG: valine--tRNA ligase [Bdellovibrionales bacterium]|nr:valine--tRNA ligase [Bdellovibrionales bacterium]
MIQPQKRELAKSFEPKGFETEVYQFWETQKCFEAQDESAPGQKAFSIMIPPPNVTGVLHIGHALTLTIEDILTRWRRMHGDNTLWLPGTDHAGIATQAQVEKAIAKEGKGPSGRPMTRHDMGREAFLKRVWKWKEDHGSSIVRQMRRLGASVDWSRERFTMDEGLSKAVREVFVKLYEDGLIYRGERIINWCVRCQTALSDLEVVPTDRKGSFWHIRYSVEGGGADVVIATTRPETLLGDSAVAVHPDDDRYKHLHGKKMVLPLLGRKIPLITDEYVDREFGSGALKVTPAHDFNDSDLGKKHGLEFIQVMGLDGKITAAGGPYAGLKFAEAREKIIADLEAAGILVKVEPHSHKVGLCQRCDTVAEPVMSKQWFVKIAPLAKPAIEAVETGKIQFSPKSWEKTYFEWMYNIRDWCISRQLWWGHQIPAWYCGKCEAVSVLRTAPTKCPSCGAGASDLRQDEDVLDTWFSSGLWTFSTLGWPEKTKALKTFYPNSIMETGFDIIFFWVARMIMMGIHFMKDVPFHKVYLHAMVRDEKGEKMSKSKGNVIDPLILMDQHGADPLRFTLTAMAGQGRDIKLAVDRVEGYRAFCNKFWNATKFFHLQMEPEQGGPVAAPAGGVSAWILANFKNLSPMHRWIISRLQSVTAEVEAGFAGFELNLSAQALYEFTWNELCDWYIEFSKLSLRRGGRDREETLYVLHYVLDGVLKLMHPIVPFVTEELWQSLPWTEPVQGKHRAAHGLPQIKTLMLQAFPEKNPALMDESAEETLKRLRAVIGAIRNFRGELNLSPKVEFAVNFMTPTAASASLMERYSTEICALARLSNLQPVMGAAAESESVIPLMDPLMELRIPLKGLINVEDETKRLKKEAERVEGDIAFIRNKLSKESFIAKAPAELVAKERAREAELMGSLKEISASIERLKKLS